MPRRSQARYNRSFGAAPTRGGRGGGGGGGGGRGGRGGAGGSGGQNRNAPPALRQSIAENFAYASLAPARAESFSALLERQVACPTWVQLYQPATRSATAGSITTRRRWAGTAQACPRRRICFTNGTVNPAISADGNIPAPGMYVGNSEHLREPVLLTGCQRHRPHGRSGGPERLVSLEQCGEPDHLALRNSARWSHKRHNHAARLRLSAASTADSTGGGGVLGCVYVLRVSRRRIPLAQTCNPCTASTQPCTESRASGLVRSRTSCSGMPQKTTVTAGHQQDLPARQLVGLVWQPTTGAPSRT
jgi:hypothetical protein